MKEKLPTPARAEIIRLRDQGMSREDIAVHFGVSLARVKRWITELKIPASRGLPSKGKVSSDGTADLGMDHGLTLIEKAKITLGPRMSQDYRGYLLDGRLVRVDILIQAAGLKVPEIP